MFIVCHYISSTEIPKFWKKKKDDANLNADEGLDLIHNIQKNESKQKDLIRRPTIANLSAYHKRTKGKGGEHIDLEKQFLEKFENIGMLHCLNGLSTISNTIDTDMIFVNILYIFHILLILQILKSPKSQEASVRGEEPSTR